MVNPILQTAALERVTYDFSWIFIAIFVVFMILIVWALKGVIMKKQ